MDGPRIGCEANRDCGWGQGSSGEVAEPVGEGKNRLTYAHMGM
jgi:hypothetical protein